MSLASPNRILWGIGAVLLISTLSCDNDDECIERIEGVSLHDTSAAISADLFSPGVPDVFIASSVETFSGENQDYPDILVAGPIAAAVGSPVLVIPGNEVPDSVEKELVRLKPLRITIIGGPIAISTTIESQLAAFTTGEVRRIEGMDRFATAAALSEAVFPNGGVPVAVLVTSSGDQIAEALAAGPLAAELGGPILLVTPTGIRDETKMELTRLQPQSIIIIGSAVSADVETELGDFTTGTVSRIKDVDRYETAVSISEATFTSDVSRVFVTEASSIPDALIASLAATVTKSPLLLIQNDSVPQSVSDELKRLQPERLTAIGGEDEVSTDLSCELASF